MAAIVLWIKNFFSHPPDSIKGFVNGMELFRAIASAIAAGLGSNAALTILGAVLAHASIIFPNPVVGGLVASILTLVVDLIRRQNAGDHHLVEVAEADPSMPFPPHIAD